MQAGDIHQLRVFIGDNAFGNTTGVVGIGPGEQREAMSERARLLGYPDTAFVSVSESGVSVDSFSPFEEMRFCTQTLLATEAVLCASGAITPGEPFFARTPAGIIRIVRYHDVSGDPVAYVDLPESSCTTRALRNRLPVPGALLLAVPLVVDTGRSRAYCLLPHEEIELAAVSPDTVRAFCADEGISGLCLTARCPDGGTRLRVFTMSLDGAEDTATGGAAGGVPVYWQQLGIASSTSTWTVHQGFAGPQTRGELRVRSLETGGFAVGGKVVPVSEGKLAHAHQISASSS